MDTKEHVEHLLKDYHEIKRSLDRLNFEIETFRGLGYAEVITALTFTNPEGELVQTSGVSDKTSRIALIYRESTDKLNFDHVKALVMKYNTQKREMDMLDYCITLLEPRMSGIITDMFIMGLSWKELRSKHCVSHTMIGNYRKKGILELERLYDVGKLVI